MSAPTAETPAAQGETTFRSFSKEQGAGYAQNRRDYHDSVYNTFLTYHEATGGKFDTVLDVGCGPGIATRTIASRFDHVVGIDQSEGMLSAARSLGGVSASSEPIRYEISGAESLGQDLSPPVQDGSVDLIIAATAAHWFDMQKFWSRAAKVLKPKGSVALWASGSLQVDPSMPNHAAIQAALDRLDESLDDYMAPGNRMVQNLYSDLPLPWALPTPVPDFDDAALLKKYWAISGEPGHEKQFYADQGPLSLDTFEKIMGTASPVARWREAHPDDARTERDVVRVARREIEAVIDQAGRVDEGKRLIKGGVRGVLLVLKRKA